MDRVTRVEPNVLSQNCESRQALDRIADKWTCLIVYALLDGPRRHGELKRMIEGISQKMLTQTLRSMETDGLVKRTVIDVIPPHVEYGLTPLGQTLSDPLVAICRWAMDHLPELQAARQALPAPPPLPESTTGGPLLRHTRVVTVGVPPCSVAGREVPRGDLD